MKDMRNWELFVERGTISIDEKDWEWEGEDREKSFGDSKDISNGRRKSEEKRKED